MLVKDLALHQQHYQPDYTSDQGAMSHNQHDLLYQIGHHQVLKAVFQILHCGDLLAFDVLIIHQPGRSVKG